jgi:ribosomal protein S18 acetylase RimI-like enzyme
MEDRDSIAALHVAVWRDTYRHLAPAAAYQALDETAREGHWDDLLGRDPAESMTVVAESAGSIVAFGHAGPSTHPALLGAGEIVHLFVHRDFQRAGLGHALLDELHSFLVQAGHLTVKLAVVIGNDRALRFYERRGSRVIGRFVDGVLWRSKNLIVELTGPTVESKLVHTESSWVNPP